MVRTPPPFLDLRQKLRVNFVNMQGLDEAGIDGGGVFREFLTEVLKTGFDPNRGYFTTNSNGQLYPNPQVREGGGREGEREGGREGGREREIFTAVRGQV